MEYCEGGSLEDIYKRAKQINGVIGETILANIAEAVSFFFFLLGRFIRELKNDTRIIY